VNAAVPALLAGAAGVASTPDGARRLETIVDQQDEGFMNNVGGAIGSRGDSIIQQGTSMLSSLTGDGMMSGFKNALAKFTGLGGGAISSLLGLLAPIVFGSLLKQKNSLGLNASGLASMLAGQKNNITAAMPAGLAGILGSVPGLSNFLGAPRETYETAASYGRDVYTRDTASTRAAPATRPGTYQAAHRKESSWLKWALPLLAVALLGWAAISWFANRAGSTGATPAPRTVAPAPTPTPAPGPAYSISGVTNEFHTVFDSATQALNGVTDVASAEQAVPKLQALNTQLDGLRNTWNRMGSTDRGTIGSLVTSSKDKLQPIIDRVMAIPGVSNVLKPHIDAMMQKLGGFTTV
jgi:hypothetical protein